MLRYGLMPTPTEQRTRKPARRIPAGRHDAPAARPATSPSELPGAFGGVLEKVSEEMCRRVTEYCELQASESQAQAA